MDSGKRRIYTKASGKLGKGIRKMKEITKDIIRELILVYPALTPCQKDILTATELLIGSYENGGKLLGLRKRRFRRRFPSHRRRAYEEFLQ